LFKLSLQRKRLWTIKSQSEAQAVLFQIENGGPDIRNNIAHKITTRHINPYSMHNQKKNASRIIDTLNYRFKVQVDCRQPLGLIQSKDKAGFWVLEQHEFWVLVAQSFT